MATLDEMLAQQAKLNAEIEKLQSKQKAEAISQVQALMQQHGLKTADLSTAALGRSAKRVSEGSKTKVAAKYRNAATGDSWSGRGLKPKWLTAALGAGQKIEDFAL